MALEQSMHSQRWSIPPEGLGITLFSDCHKAGLCIELTDEIAMGRHKEIQAVACGSGEKGGKQRIPHYNASSALPLDNTGHLTAQKGNVLPTASS
eukprot:scaffold247_cov172-Ochromonas_danica.AAC.29